MAFTGFSVAIHQNQRYYISSNVYIFNSFMTGGSIQKVETKFFRSDLPFKLTSGRYLPEIQLAYETYGELNGARDNAVLVFHALTGSQHAAGINTSVDGIDHLWTDECHLGWWDSFIGPDPSKALDTTKHFVICINYLGGCYGSTGPSSINPETGREYGGAFPRISIADIVKSQKLLIDQLGITRLHAVIGPSLGGLMCLTYAGLFPENVLNIISIASGFNVPALQKLFALEQIMAIENDPHFNDGNYYQGEHPWNGLCLARMISHKTFISLYYLEDRAKGEVRQFDDHFKWYTLSDPMESYMLHQGRKFVSRFDANTYLRMMEAWQTFDHLKLSGAADNTCFFENSGHHNYLIFSIDSDVCFYPEQQSDLNQLLKENGIHAMHITVHSEKGHDSFLLEPDLFAPHLSFALARQDNL